MVDKIIKKNSRIWQPYWVHISTVGSQAVKVSYVLYVRRTLHTYPNSLSIGRHHNGDQKESQIFRPIVIVTSRLYCEVTVMNYFHVIRQLHERSILSQTDYKTMPLAIRHKMRDIDVTVT